MAKKIIRHSYIPDTSVYQSSLEIEETNQNNNNSQTPQPEITEEEDKLDSTISLINNRFHLDESVMIVYDPIKDDLIISAREGNSGGGSNSQVMQELAKKLNIDGTNLNYAVFSSFLANKDFTNVDLSYLKNILELNLLAKKDGSDIDIEKIKERLGVINNSQPSGVTRDELLDAIRTLASKSGYDIDVEVLRNRLGIDTTVLAKVDASNIDVSTWRSVLGISDDSLNLLITNFQELKNNYNSGEGINVDAWKTKLGVTTSEIKGQVGIEGVLKATSSDIDVAAWKKLLSEDTVSGDDFE